MLNFSQYLTEVFDKVYDFTLTQRKTEVEYDFVTKDNRKVNVYIHHNDKKEPFRWDVEFSVGDSFKITNDGDQFAIFATVLACIKDFIEKRNPEILTFTAQKAMKSKDIDTDSRATLYSAMVRKFANANGFNFKDNKIDIGRKYVLKKMN